MGDVLRLGKNHDRRLRAGHLWIYSNEIDTEATPLKGFEPGQVVNIENAQGKWQGLGYVNPNSLICARLVTRSRGISLDGSLLVHRIKVAVALRERLYAKPYYRLLFGEADGTPGVVVDRYGDYLVVQITTAGMELLKDALIAALVKVLKPAGILMRNDSGIRELEGLSRYVELAHGQVPDRVLVEEGGCRFEVSPGEGQKTGWFYDQASNRRAFLKYVAGARVLDVFSYLGAWGLAAARTGAADVTCVDSSAPALELLETTAAANDLAVRTLRDDAFDALASLREAGERYDVIVVDPPAFIKRRRDIPKGQAAYRKLNQLAMQLLPRDGILVSCSCSHHLAQDELIGTVQQAARHVGRFAQIVEVGGHAPDHPLHPAIPESRYLKALFCRVVND